MMRVPQHVVDGRRKQLAEILQDEGFLPLGELCRRLDISEPTARRDLIALERDRTITRTRGGALCDFNQRFSSFRERQKVAAAAKRRIARAAAELIEPGMTIFLDAGSTLHAIAEVLVRDRGKSPLAIVTNSLPTADLLADHEGITVNLLGGQYLRRMSVLLGPEAVRHLQAWRFDLALISAEGMDAEGLSNSQADVVAVQQAAIERSVRHAACIHGGKLAKRAPEPLMVWDRLERLVTDASLARIRAASIALPIDRITVA